jgi:transcriptional antiterminator RfaH
VQIVRFGGYPLPVAGEIIDEIRHRIDGQADREPYLKFGERVVITEGSFAGIEAIFLATDEDERVVLLLNILQSDQRLSFPIGSVRKVHD